MRMTNLARQDLLSKQTIDLYGFLLGVVDRMVMCFGFWLHRCYFILGRLYFSCSSYTIQYPLTL